MFKLSIVNELSEQENTNKFVYDSNKKKLKYHSHFLVLSKEERANKWKMTNKKAKENFGL